MAQSPAGQIASPHEPEAFSCQDEVFSLLPRPGTKTLRTTLGELVCLPIGIDDSRPKRERSESEKIVVRSVSEARERILWPEA
jgi:hypothetical protein